MIANQGAEMTGSWNEKGWSEHSEETMAGLIGKKVRQFRNILTALRRKDKVSQQRRGDHKTAKLYPKIRVEGCDGPGCLDSFRGGIS